MLSLITNLATDNLQEFISIFHYQKSLTKMVFTQHYLFRLISNLSIQNQLPMQRTSNFKSNGTAVRVNRFRLHFNGSPHGINVTQELRGSVRFASNEADNVSTMVPKSASPIMASNSFQTSSCFLGTNRWV